MEIYKEDFCRGNLPLLKHQKQDKYDEYDKMNCGGSQKAKG